MIFEYSVISLLSGPLGLRLANRLVVLRLKCFHCFLKNIQNVLRCINVLKYNIKNINIIKFV